jgi:hypothetical protein
MQDLRTAICHFCRTPISRPLRQAGRILLGTPESGTYYLWDEAAAQSQDRHGEPVREDLDGCPILNPTDLLPDVACAGELRFCPNGHQVGRLEAELLGTSSVALARRAVDFVGPNAYVNSPRPVSNREDR